MEGLVSGFKLYELNGNEDLDDIKDSGIYKISSSNVKTHSPVENPLGSFVQCLRYSSSSASQILFGQSLASIYYRFNSGGVWKEWTKLP